MMAKGGRAGSLTRALANDGETPIQARKEAPLALTADGGGADADPGGNGSQRQATGQVGLDDRTVLGGQVLVVTTHRATP
jgi:hypothetical protein